ncbi:MAG TPA: endonuclease/exonuclease/phosphatase family protein [Kofleriaceae bacterium]
MTRIGLSRIVGMAALLCSACTGEGADEPLEPDSVLTYNIYLGADIAEPLRASSMQELAGRIEAAFATFQANDFAQRAEAIADRIAEDQPTFVGLQEVVTVYIQPDGDRRDGGFAPATELVIDFEQVLLAELVERGLDYRVAVRGENSDVEVPSASGEDIRLIDHDMILVRADITVEETHANQYAARLPIPMPDGASTIELIRGFVAAVVTLNGTPTLVVSTHLETSRVEPVQLAQAGELLAWLAGRSEPVILVGDFNSNADPAESTQTYDLIETAGYTDAWELRADSTDPGYTCCHASDLRNTTPQLEERVDFIWLLGSLPSGTPDVHLIGEQEAHRTRSGLWPSNHAGVVMTFAQ